MHTVVFMNTMVTHGWCRVTTNMPYRRLSQKTDPVTSTG